MAEVTDIKNDFFNAVFSISPNSFSEIKKNFHTQTFPANALFIKASQKSRSEFFIVNGYCRSFVLNSEGEEITLSFFKKGGVITPNLIRTRNDVSILNYQALTNSELVEFDTGEFLNLMIHNLEIRELGNAILRNELVQMKWRW